MNENLNIYCVTNKDLKFLKNLNFYNLAAVGKNNFSKEYIRSDTLENIFHKEEYYSELTFHYWFWKNELPKYLNDENIWIGFCQKRRFWSQTKKNSLKMDLVPETNFLKFIPDEWNSYNSIICEPLDVSIKKKIKLIKKGWRNIIKDPSILFTKKKHSIELHFDMFHGYKILDKAIDLMSVKDKLKFKYYVSHNNKFNPHIMFITKPKIANKWFRDLFNWLDNCESYFDLKDLKGYETKRLFAYLAERYLSFWFKEYSNYLEWPYIFYDAEKKD